MLWRTLRSRKTTGELLEDNAFGLRPCSTSWFLPLVGATSGEDPVQYQSLRGRLLQRTPSGTSPQPQEAGPRLQEKNVSPLPDQTERRFPPVPPPFQHATASQLGSLDEHHHHSEDTTRPRHGRLISCSLEEHQNHQHRSEGHSSVQTWAQHRSLEDTTRPPSLLYRVVPYCG